MANESTKSAKVNGQLSVEEVSENSTAAERLLTLQVIAKFSLAFPLQLL